MNEQNAAGSRLLRQAGPFLERRDFSGLTKALTDSWSPECLVLLLTDDDAEVIETAAVCVGLIGDMGSAPALAELLHHDRASVVAAAEDALWSVWFRDGGTLSQAVLRRIATSVESGEMENVIPLLTEIIKTQPTFAEPYHQRSQVHYLQNNYPAALRDARRAFELNPLHFGALANQAHAHAALGHYQEAFKLYREVLSLHPCFPGIRSAMHQVRQLLSPLTCGAG